MTCRQAPDPEIHFERLAITLEQTPRVGSADTANQSQRYALKGTSVC